MELAFEADKKVASKLYDDDEMSEEGKILH